MMKNNEIEVDVKKSKILKIFEILISSSCSTPSSTPFFFC